MRVVGEPVDVEGQICLAEIGTMKDSGMPSVAVDDMRHRQLLATATQHGKSIRCNGSCLVVRWDHEPPVRLVPRCFD